MSAPKVDVLAVMDRTVRRLRDSQRLSRTPQGKEAYAAPLDEARAAVAELIEQRNQLVGAAIFAASVLRARGGCTADERDDAVSRLKAAVALARVGGDA